MLVMLVMLVMLSSSPWPALIMATATLTRTTSLTSLHPAAILTP